ncbi:MAG: hypothetical protein JWM04_2241 [Verrucomicrobiales bacterium]|nr:hypothetical protein [Verrucomicrobiales bacterium]
MRAPTLALFLLLSLQTLMGADWLDKLGKAKDILTSTPGVTNISGLSDTQIVAALKEALAKGVENAVTNLGKSDGFLADANVKIPLPESLLTIEKGLRAVGQTKLADDFVVTMNRAAEQAVPEAATVLADSVRQMTFADASSLLTSTNTAATEYFKRTSSTNLYAKFKPIIVKATESTGVTGAYKAMTTKIAPSGLGRFGSILGVTGNLDVDDYVTHKTIDGLFLKIAEQEKLIRENPAARTSELLQKVFGSVKKAQ